MNFGHFKKYEKPLLWATVIFCVIVFTLFTGFDDLVQLLRGGSADTAGRFTVLTTGESVEISTIRFEQSAQNMGRLVGRQADFTDDDVWVHLMNVADAEGAGLRISDQELANALTGGGQYAALYLSEGAQAQYRQAGFPSRKQYESAVRDLLLAQRWVQLEASADRYVSADEVYLRWSLDHELFDLDALVFEDEEPDAIPDPGDAELQEHWDGYSEGIRDSRFKDPAKFDIAWAALPLDADLSTLPPEKVATLAEPSEAEIISRFNRVRTARDIEATEPDEALSAALANEVKVIALARQADAAMRALEEADTESVLAVAREFGLVTGDPEGLLDPEALKALDPPADDTLEIRLRSRQPGDLVFVDPFGDRMTVYVAYVQERTENRPLTFEEAREALIEDWKTTQRDRAARAFRDELRDRARALDDVAAALAPMEAAALAQAEAIIASDPELDAEGQQALRDEALAGIELDVLGRLAEDEHRVWDELVAETVAAGGVERVAFAGVGKDYARAPDEADEAGSFARFTKGHPAVFAQGVDGITDVLRDVVGERSVIVRVTGRSLPGKDAMFADTEGLEQARLILGFQRQSQAQQQTVEPALVMAAHDLQVVEIAPPANAGGN